MQVSTLDIKAFLSSIHPFDLVDEPLLSFLASKVDIAYFKESQTVAKRGEKVDSFYIVAKGAVKECGEEPGDDYLLEKDFFDFASVVAKNYSSDYECVQEALLYAIPAKLFLDTVHKNSVLESYFLQNSAKKLQRKSKSLDGQLIKRVADISFKEPLFIDENSSIYSAVQMMSEAKKTFILVNFKDGSLGIVTDNDLRNKVLLNRVDLELSIASMATRNPVCIDADDFLFNALLLLTRHAIKRVVVKKDSNVLGVIDETDILGAFSMQAHFIARKIELAETTQELKKVLSEVESTVASLLSEGVKVKYICKLVVELNKRAFAKVFEWCFDEDARQNCALVVMGSEGRGEQILKTDQDNALIIKDGYENDGLVAMRERFTSTLIELGFPECNGGVMVKNEAFAKHLSWFKKELFDMINKPSQEGFTNLAVWLDMRFVAGQRELFDELKEYLYKHIHDTPNLSAYMAKAALAFETPIGIFNSFLLEKKEHAGELDIKKGAIFAIVHGIRCMAYENNIKALGTFERIKELCDMKAINHELADELAEGYDFLLEIRLKQRLLKIKMAQEPDNFIAVSKLSKLERDLLKEVLRIVERFKKFLFAHFKLGFIA